MKKKAEHIALIGLLGALALVLGILENLLPPLPGMPPGAKAGLSNLVTMFAAGAIGLPAALFIAAIKGLFAFLTRGVSAGLMSLCGGLLSRSSWAYCGKKQNSRRSSSVSAVRSGTTSHSCSSRYG